MALPPFPIPPAVLRAGLGMRRRIQDLIARTFYRRKYDAVRVLAAFGVTCRDETDLRRLGDNMVRVVEETMHPVDISLWLRDTPVEGA